MQVGFEDSSLDFVDSVASVVSRARLTAPCLVPRNGAKVETVIRRTFGKSSPVVWLSSSSSKFEGGREINFQHVVFLVKMVVEYAIPDIPSHVFIQQQRERLEGFLKQLLLPDISQEQLCSKARQTRREARSQ